MSPFDFTCRLCKGKMTVNVELGELQCTRCGALLDGSKPKPSIKALPGTETDDTPQESWNMGGMLFDGEMTPWLQSRVNTLRQYLHQGERQKAIDTCHRLLQTEPGFLDAHKWIGRLSLDTDEKRTHLSKFLALQPGDAEATRELMILNGDLTREEADRAAKAYDTTDVQTAGSPVDVDTEALLCPICRGGLTISDDGGVTCAFCGYEDADPRHARQASSAASFAVALIKHRGQATRWQIGERMVHCNECAAERVLPEGKMSSRCPFCGSNHVIVQDALGVFRQPDGLVKFRVRRQEAEDRVQEQLGSRVEKFKGWFVNNRVIRTTFQGVYLPFWVFDIFGKVILRDEYTDQRDMTPRIERTEHITQLRHATVPGVKSPPRHMLKRLGTYNMNEIVPYTPKLLAKFAAELYAIDFDEASMDVRDVFRDDAKDKYGHWQPNVQRTITTQIDHMDMRLLLLPVWTATLLEDDGDIRTALVNGQTGQVVMGKARKPAP